MSISHTPSGSPRWQYRISSPQEQVRKTRRVSFTSRGVAAQIATPMFPMYVASKHAVQAFVRCLADLEARNGVRVTAVDPGIVKTPMWTENPAINVALGEEDGWVTAEEVAQVMLACVRDEVVGARFGSGDGDAGGEMIEIKGGSCLEVTTGRVRDVPLYGNVGPFAAGGKGARATKAQVLEDQVLGRLQSGWGEVLIARAQ